MSGHSKWANIRLKKGAEDKKRAKEFTKAARIITAAVKEGKSGDITANPTLRTAVDKARASNMPKDNIQRAIARGEAFLGKGRGVNGVSYEEIVYEAYGPDGVALVINVVTDNKNRIVGELKFLLKNYGGALGESGSAAYAFANGVPTFKIPVADKQKIQDLLDELDELEDVVSVIHNAEL